jgi:hypothetical protein
MALAKGVSTCMAELRFTAADVAAGGTEPEVELATALQTAIRLRLWKRLRHVVA